MNKTTILPFEVWDHILKYNDHRDTRNLACCCRDIFALLKPLIWRNVTIRYPVCGSLRREEDYLQNLQHTENISFTHSTSISFTSNRLSEKGKEELMFDFTVHLSKFLSYFNIRKLRALKMDAVASDSCFEFIIKHLSYVRNLTVLSRVSGWSSLRTVENLQSLDLYSCGLADRDLENILGLEKLETLLIKCCKYLSDRSLATVEKLKSLTSLAFLYNGYKDNPKPLFDHKITGMQNVTDLNLASVSISDESMAWLCEHLTNLKRLKLACVNVSDEGLSGLHFLAKLTCLDIEQCDELTEECFIYMESLVSLRTVYFDANICRKDEDDPVPIWNLQIRNTLGKLNNIKSLQSIHIRKSATRLNRRGMTRVINNGVDSIQDAAFGYILEVLCVRPKWSLKMSARGVYVLYRSLRSC